MLAHLPSFGFDQIPRLSAAPKATDRPWAMDEKTPTTGELSQKQGRDAALGFIVYCIPMRNRCFLPKSQANITNLNPFGLPNLAVTTLPEDDARVRSVRPDLIHSRVLPLCRE